MRILQPTTYTIFGLIALFVAFPRASAQTSADTVALSASVGLMIGRKYQAAGGAQMPTMRAGLLGRRADSAFDAALRSPFAESDAPRRSETNVAHNATVTIRLKRLEWRGDSAVAGIESESCDPRMESGMNWWRSEQAYVFLRHPTERWRFLRPLIGGLTQDGTCRRPPAPER